MGPVAKGLWSLLVSAETMVLKFTVATRRLRRQIDDVRWSLGMACIRFDAALHGHSDRETGHRELSLALELQAENPAWDVQVITTNEGRCRVIARQLGGWA